MCGICGFVGFRDDRLLDQMVSALTHRGPDDHGSYIDSEVSLGVRRLSIIDLVTGNQPIANEDRTVWVVYNGEIYNFQEITEWLISKGHLFASRSDTEIIVHAYEEEGIDCVNRFNGMFAFALWDSKLRTLFLVRDRLGKKPLHYVMVRNKILFASEIKALLICPEWKRSLSFRSIDDFLTLRYVPGSGSLFSEVKTLEPGHVLKLHDRDLTVSRYWKVQMEEPTKPYSIEQYVERFDRLLYKSVQRRLVSDVPVGIYLSGGLDSTLISSYIRKVYSDIPFVAFSHGFDEQHDELSYARMAAHAFGFEHREVLIRKEHLQLLPKIIWHMDMPIANSDIVGFFLLAKLAKTEVKVVLSGEGADELMGSYVHQQAICKISELRRLVPEGIVNGFLLPVVHSVPLAFLNQLFHYPGYSLDDGARDRIANFLAASDLPTRYFSLNSLFASGDKEQLYTAEFKAVLDGESQEMKELKKILLDGSIPSILNRLILLKYMYWLPIYCLLKEDKISMSQGLEQRFPFLDHELVEFMAGVPPELKLSGWTRKYLQRKVAKGKVPKAILRRQKGPILVPLGRCFGQEFDNLVADVLSEERVKRRGYFQYSYIKKLLLRRGESPFIIERQLFALVALELWHRIFVDGEVP